jgi:AcrR family transcriptional regulator
MVTGSTRDARRRRPARRGQGAALREEIIGAASRELARSGDANRLTLRGIAREVGVAATSIYLHFSTIEDLLLAVKTARFEEFDLALAAAADAAGADPYQRVRARLHAYIDFALANPGEYTVMFAARLVPASDHGEAPAHLSLHAIAEDARAILSTSPSARSRSGVRANVRSLTADQQEEAISKEALMCAFHVWNALHGMLTLRRFRPDMPWPDLREQVDDLVARILGGTATNS